MVFLCVAVPPTIARPSSPRYYQVLGGHSSISLKHLRSWLHWSLLSGSELAASGRYAIIHVEAWRFVIFHIEWSGPDPDGGERGGGGGGFRYISLLSIYPNRYVPHISPQPWYPGSDSYNTTLFHIISRRCYTCQLITNPTSRSDQKGLKLTGESIYSIYGSSMFTRPDPLMPASGVIIIDTFEPHTTAVIRINIPR